MKKKKKQTLKDKILEILKSYKTIIYVSFLINIVMLVFSYNIMTSNHEYVFSGSDENFVIKDGLIVLNNDLNILYGNNIKYINKKDYEVKKIKIGYYVKKVNDDFSPLIEKDLSFDEKITINELVNNFINFNIVEKNSAKNIFTEENVKLMNDGIYLIFKAETKEEKIIESKIKLNIEKISKF